MMQVRNEGLLRLLTALPNPFLVKCSKSDSTVGIQIKHYIAITTNRFLSIVLELYISIYLSAYSFSAWNMLGISTAERILHRRLHCTDLSNVQLDKTWMIISISFLYGNLLPWSVQACTTEISLRPPSLHFDILLTGHDALLMCRWRVLFESNGAGCGGGMFKVSSLGFLICSFQDWEASRLERSLLNGAVSIVILPHYYERTLWNGNV